MGAKKDIKTALCQKTTETDWIKVLAIPWNRKKIRKAPNASRGLEPIWEIPYQMENIN